MKVVINICYGGFGLSSKAVERCIELGLGLTEYKGNFYADPDAYFVKINEEYFCIKGDDKEFRCNPVLIQVIEELGSGKASGNLAKLKIVEIPFDTTEGWDIDEYDGFERIEESHRFWD